MDDNSKYTGAYADLLTQVAENVEAVYAAGVKSEYDRYWDACQDYGNRNVYSYFCYYQNRVGDYFYPKYDIRPRLADYFMRDAKMYGNETTLDFVERLKECGVVFDISNCTNITYLFYSARVSHLPELDVRAATAGANSLLFGGYVETIDNFITDETQLLDNAFGYASSLVNIKFGGIVGKNIKMSDCKKLSHESIMNLFNALKDFSGTATTQTCTLGEANLAKLTDTEKAIATEKGWTLA